MLYLNFVTVSRLERNPTIKAEIQLRGFERDIPAGFFATLLHKLPILLHLKPLSCQLVKTKFQ
jgi:hypothetical protein